MIGEARIGDAALHGFHLVNIFFQLLVYCIFAERLTQKVISRELYYVSITPVSFEINKFFFDK